MRSSQLKSMRVGYTPYSRDLTQPTDRRRFPHYASLRGIDFELAEPHREYDLVVVTPRADLEAWADYRPGRAKVVYDMVDSYLEIPWYNPKALLRGTAKFAAGEASRPFYSYRRAILRVLARADAAVCATPEQALTIGRHCPNVHAIVDFLGEVLRRVKTDYEAGSPFHLVWEGQGRNVRWFSEIRGALAEVGRRHPIVLHLITELEYHEFVERFWRRNTRRLAERYCDGDVRLYQWSKEMAAVIATACDLAVIPLPIGRSLETAKPENKLLAFWQLGLPTVTSSTPAYVRTMRNAGQAHHCRSEPDWVATMLQLIEDDAARAEAGRGGRAFAERYCGEDTLLAAWDRVFETL